MVELVNGFQPAALKGGKWRQIFMSKGNKLRQICRRLLSLFESAANAARFIGRMAKGMVSSLCRMRMKARRPREIRLGRMLADAPLISWRSRVGSCA
ncbi:MAG: hypothetical protein DME21_06560 [Verrucomicrobia bacterium]|nr:MAG: hypothetical protein DME21_06560 [Verrucomicrobiota bacterium]